MACAAHNIARFFHSFFSFSKRYRENHYMNIDKNEKFNDIFFIFKGKKSVKMVYFSLYKMIKSRHFLFSTISLLFFFLFMGYYTYTYTYTWFHCGGGCIHYCRASTRWTVRSLNTFRYTNHLVVVVKINKYKVLLSFYNL